MDVWGWTGHLLLCVEGTAHADEAAGCSRGRGGLLVSVELEKYWHLASQLTGGQSVRTVMELSKTVCDGNI